MVGKPNEQCNINFYKTQFHPVTFKIQPVELDINFEKLQVTLDINGDIMKKLTKI